MRTPSGTPTAMAATMPIAKARKVVTVPLQNLLVPNSSPMAASTSLKGGSRKTRPARPTISQRTIQMMSEAIIGTSRPNMRIRVSLLPPREAEGRVAKRPGEAAAPTLPHWRCRPTRLACCRCESPSACGEGFG